MKTFNYNQLVLHYVDQGSSSENVVIFIHGNSHSHRTFRNQLSDKRFKNFRLIAVDLPGHGDSSRSPQYDMALFVNSLKALIESLNISNFVLVGHSLGGHIAIESLKQLNPKGIAIFAAPPLRNPPDFSAFRDNPNTPFLFKNELTDGQKAALIQSFYSSYSTGRQDFAEFNQTDGIFRESFAQSVAALKFDDEVELLNGFEGHKLIMHGLQDVFIDLNYIYKNVHTDTLWNGSVLELNSSHNMHVENSDEFNHALLPFLQASFNLPIPANHLDAVTMKLL